MFRSKGRNQMEFKRSILSAAIVGATVFSSTAAAETSVNAGFMSDYLFRGIPQSGGTAAFGGIDYADASGFYAGAWAAQIGFAGGAGGAGSELDLYAGFSGESETLGYDFGAIYYYYSEEDEAVSSANEPDPSNNTFELYGSLSAGMFSLGLYFAPDTYFSFDGEAIGISVGFSAPITDAMTFDVSLQHNSGDGNELILQSLGSTDDSYIDYSIGINAESESGLFMGLSLVGTDIESPNAFGPGDDFEDEMKVIVSGGFAFDI